MAQLQALFSIRKITSQKTKFANVVKVLPPEVVDKVTDLLDAVLEINPYDTLKRMLKDAMLRDLFNNISPCDRIPSQLLSYMRAQLGQNTMCYGG